MHPFLGEIRIFPFDFAPVDWAFCEGQVMRIGDNTPLFSVIGTTYGGDGKHTFALPNLSGRVPMHPGYFRSLGETGGEDTVTLREVELGMHGHDLLASQIAGSLNSPLYNILCEGTWGSKESGGGMQYYKTASPNTNLNPQYALSAAGGGMPHNNLMPYLTMRFCIALQGIFPPHG